MTVVFYRLKWIKRFPQASHMGTSQQLMHMAYSFWQDTQLISRVLRMGVRYQMWVKATKENSHPQYPAIHIPQSKVINLYRQLRQNRKQRLEHVQTKEMLWIPSGSAKTSSNATCIGTKNRLTCDLDLLIRNDRDENRGSRIFFKGGWVGLIRQSGGSRCKLWKIFLFIHVINIYKYNIKNQ